DPNALGTRDPAQPGWQPTASPGVAPGFAAGPPPNADATGAAMFPGPHNEHGNTREGTGYNAHPMTGSLWSTSGAGSIAPREAQRLSHAELDQWGRGYFYRRALLADPRLAGRLDVQMTIDPNGRVSAVSASPSLNENLRPAADFRACVE